MAEAEIKVFRRRKLPHTREEGLPERPIMRPCGQDFVDGGLVDGRLALGVAGDREALPLHACRQDPQEAGEDAMLPQGALEPPLGHREVREDTWGALVRRALDRQRRRCGRGAHQARASCEDDSCVLDNPMTSETTRG